MYITLNNLIQIGIFLTGFTVMLLGLLSFIKKKQSPCVCKLKAIIFTP